MDWRADIVRMSKEDLSAYSCTEFRVKNKIGSYTIQYDLFDDKYVRKIDKVYCTLMGNFYELIACMMFGGKLIPQNMDLTQPDVKINKHKYIEVKGIGWVHQCKFATDQLEKYRKWPYYLDYCIYKHSLVKPLKKFVGLDKKQILKLLTENIAFMVKMPFVLLDAIVSKEDPARVGVSFYRGSRYQHQVRMSSTVFKRILIDPYKQLKEMGISTGRYRFIKRHLPNGLFFNNVEVKPFPILIIKDRMVEKASGLVPF